MFDDILGNILGCMILCLVLINVVVDNVRSQFQLIDIAQSLYILLWISGEL